AIPPTAAPPMALAPTAAPPTTAPASGTADWKADGVIQPGEYAHSQAYGQVTFHWRNDTQQLYFAMEAATTGWVAVGLAPENRMQGADFVLGSVKDGQAQIFDAYGQGQVGATHPADDTIGGKNDIVAFAGVEVGDHTLFEVQIPLDSGDKYDRALKPGGTYPLIVAIGAADEFNARHTFRGGGQFTLD
ncbi:MAG: DOMON domain-containing protein, partial [Chloroflexota bacterium]